MPGKSANLTLAVAVLMQPGVGRSSRTDFDSSCSQQGCACWHPFPRIRDYWLDLSVPVFFFANQKQRRSLWICTFVIFRFQKIAIKRALTGLLFQKIISTLFGCCFSDRVRGESKPLQFPGRDLRKVAMAPPRLHATNWSTAPVVGCFSSQQYR